MSPFEFVKAINKNQDIMVDDITESHYKPFLTNQTFGKFIDTVLLANEMNFYHHLDKKLQFQFFINTVRKGNRFEKNTKKESSDDIEVVKEYFGYSNEKARDALRLLSNDQLIELKNKVYKGGTTRKPKAI